MSLFDPSVSVFVGDDKFTGDAYVDQTTSKQSNSSGAPVSHYEVPVHVVLPFEMCDALHRGKDSKFLENLQLRLGNDVYTLQGKDILDAKLSNQDVITLKDEQHVNMIDSWRPPVYNNLEVDLSYVTGAVSQTVPMGDIKVPLVIRVPSERPADVNQISVVSPRDLTQEMTSRSENEITKRFDSVMPISQYTPREGVDQTMPEMFSDPNETVQLRARAILNRGVIPDDIKGIDHYKPPLDLRKADNSRQTSAMKMSVRSYNSNPSGVSRYTTGPKSGHRYTNRGYGASTSSVLNSGRARTRRTHYSEPIYSTSHKEEMRTGAPTRYTTHGGEQPLGIPLIDEGEEEDNSVRTMGRHNYRPPQHRRVDKAKTITFYRNGDAQFPGYTTSVSTREFRSWETLLVFLSDKISLPYGVRYIYTLGGQLIQSILSMEDGQAYVCASGQFVVNVQFGNSNETKWKRNRKSSGGKTRKADTKLLEETNEEIIELATGSARRGGASRGSNMVYRRQSNDVPAANPNVITVISNTHRDSRAKMIVNPRTRQSFMDFLEDISSNIAMSSPPVRKLYTAKTGERVTSFFDMFGKFRFHESFIACGMENFKGNMNGNHLKLPPTISEGSEEQNSYSNQYKTNLKQQNVANNRRINNNKRRPLRTLQQLENSMEASMSPRDMDNDRNNRNGVGVSMDTRFGDRSEAEHVLDGEAERRKLFNDDMMEGEGQGGDFEEDVVIGGQSEGVVGMRGGEGGTNYSFHNQYSNSQQNTNLRGTRNEMITVQLRGKSRDFFVPTEFVDEDLESPTSKPNKKLSLEWVYGYRGYDSRMNLFCLPPSGELCYYVGSVAVLYDKRVEVQRHYTGHNEDISSMAVHPSGSIIATGQKKGSEKANWGHVRIWDTDSLSTHAILGLSHFDGAVCILNFSQVNNGEWLMSVDAGDGHVMTVWDWDKETVIAKTKTTADTVVCGSFHPNDDRCVVSGGKQHLYFWRLINGRILRDKKSGQFKDEIPHYITCLTFNFEGEVISGDSSGNIIVWGRDKRNIFYVKHTIIRAHEKSVFSLAHLQDGTLVSGGGLDRRIIAWDGAQDYRSAKAGRQLPEAIGGVRMLATSASGGVDGQLFVGTTKNIVIEGSLQQKFTSIIQGHYEEVWALACHPSEEFFVTGGFDQQICMWNALSHKLQWKVFTEKPCMTCVFHPSGTVVGVGQSSGRFVVLNAYSGIHVTSFHVSTEQIDVAKISPDGGLLAIGCHDKNIHIFDVQDNGLSFKRRGSMSGHNSFVMQIDWSDDSNFIQSVSANYNLLFWDVLNLRPESGKKTKDMKWHTHSSVLGFHVAGVWPALPKATNANTCAVSDSRQLVVSGDSRGSVRMFQFPASHYKCFFTEQKMCSSNVTQLEFLQADKTLIATAGPDACLFQYHLIDP